MATVITSECINCGACEAECPNTAIYQGGVEWELNGVTHAAIANDIFYIVPEKCTECVGFYDHEACAAVCPVDCCIPDPNIPETQDVLIARAKQLHADKTFGDDFPSRFKKGGAVQPAAAPAAPAAVAETPKPAPAAAAPAPAAAAAAPAPAPAPKPAPAPAAPAPVAAPEPAPATAAPAAAPAPAPAPAMAAPAAAVSVSLPEIEEWEVPIECFRCHGTYAVAFKHFRSGVVLYCPFCQGSYVVNTAMHGHVSRALREFHTQWTKDFHAFQEQRQRELEEFEERQRTRLQAFNDSLKTASHEFKPPGAPKRRAWIFG